jgi:hypothetical protein
VGAVLGGINDYCITCRLSPEYFRLGKGIPGGDGFPLRVLILGLLAGVGPGAMTASVYLFVNSRNKDVPRLPWMRLSLWLGIPMAVAAGLALTLPFFLATWDPLGFRSVLHRLLDEDQIRRFLFVWWIHLSLYVGALLGLAGGAVAIHRTRRRRALRPMLDA